MTEDTRKFDGPYDKHEMRLAEREIVQDVLKADLLVRVPGSAPVEDEKANRGRLVKVEQQLGDSGYRWTHLYLDLKEEGEPVSFDAGECGLWVGPLGWRVLMAWHHGDPTYGLNVAIIDPLGAVYKKAEQAGPEIRSWVDGELP